MLNFTSVVTDNTEYRMAVEMYKTPLKAFNFQHTMSMLVIKLRTIVLFVFQLITMTTLSKIPTGSDPTNATSVLLNTDIVYSQNRSRGWFTFSTAGFTNVSGNVVNLKNYIDCHFIKDNSV